MADQALLKAETPWDAGAMGQGWGQPPNLELHPCGSGCALQTGFLERS